MSFLNLQNVLITDEVDDKCVDILRSNGIEVVKNTKLSKEELIAEIPVSDQSIDMTIDTGRVRHKLCHINYN